MTGDQVPADRAEQDRVGRTAALFGAVGPVARSVLEVELAAARNLVERERHADRRTDELEQGARVGDDLDTDAITRQQNELVRALRCPLGSVLRVGRRHRARA
jgi:hypothetical protein